jgi:excisionase family DNA binding protein
MEEEKNHKPLILYNQIMTPKEAALYLGIHIITMYRLIKKGDLPCFKIGGQWRFKRDILDAWIEKKINCKKQGG